MGLDMYAYAAPRDAITAEVDLDLKTIEGIAEIHYWRKHPNLHGFMRELYFRKGGTSEVFDLNPVVLTLEDLDDLEAAILDNTLPRTSGFFFGESDGSEREDDLAFIDKARQAIGVGKAIIYDSWW